MLSQINNSFSKSNLKVKIQLIILPIFCIYFYFYFFDNKVIIANTNSLNNINDLLVKKFNGSYLSLIRDIEAFCVSERIKIDSINYKKNKLLIEGRSSLEKINKIIIKIEHINNFYNINSLNIEQIAKKDEYISDK